MEQERDLRLDITDMQCNVFRMAQKKWKKTPGETADLFRKHDIFGFIEDCYDSLHLSSYGCAVEEVELLMRNRGEQV